MGCSWLLTAFLHLLCFCARHMYRLNATVIGSKSAKEDDDTAAAAADGEDGAHAEANGEAKEAMEEAVQEEEDA